MADRVRVAVVGSGIGQQHVEAYRTLPDRFVVVAICDVDATRAEAVAAAHGIPRVLTDLDELCRMDDVEVIDLCTPPHLHVPQLVSALEAGRHVICEKPLAPSLGEVDRIIAAERRS